MLKFYLCWPHEKIFQTLSEKLGSTRKCQTVSGKLAATSNSAIFQTSSEKFEPQLLSKCFPLPWSAYVSLLSVKNEHARNFYETEALRGVLPLNTVAESAPKKNPHEPPNLGKAIR